MGASFWLVELFRDGGEETKKRLDSRSNQLRFERFNKQTTAGHPNCLHAGGSVAGSASRVANRGRRHELLLAVGAFVSSLSEHISPEQPGGAQLVESCLLDGPALNCNQWHVPGAWVGLHSIATRTCLGSAPLLGWDVESRCWRGAPWAAQLFPPRRWF